MNGGGRIKRVNTAASEYWSPSNSESGTTAPGVPSFRASRYRLRVDPGNRRWAKRFRGRMVGLHAHFAPILRDCGKPARHLRENGYGLPTAYSSS